MAKAGDELVNPVTGLRTVFRMTAQETSGELLQVDGSALPVGPRVRTTSIRTKRSVSRFSPVGWAYGRTASSVSMALAT
jgi:hypothetical protein